MVMEPPGFDINPTLTTTLAETVPVSWRQPMTQPVPIACALTAAAWAERARRWQRLIDRALAERTETAGGVRLRFRLEGETELRALTAVESRCCPWASWTVTAGPGEAT